MDEQLLSTGVVLVVLLFLRFGGRVSDVICNAIDPPPDVVRENLP